MPLVAKSYASPTVVLLAYDWPEGNGRNDFLGFAIERRPGFQAAVSWLPNRIGFNGPKADHSDFPSKEAPIQKFYWWDARIDTKDRGTTFSYRLIPVVGRPGALQLLDAQAATIDVRIPHVEENGITTHFNRAIVSSQAFSAKFPRLDTPSQQKAARAWLGNGLEQAVPEFLDRAAGKDIEGAIYHLTDGTWIIPALQHYGGAASLVYNRTAKDHTSDDAIKRLIDGGRPSQAFVARTHANIMHDKFLVRVGHGDQAEAVLMGSTNFTPEALSVQANVLHAFESPGLAALYLARKRLLDGDPRLNLTAKEQTGWSAPIAAGDAIIRAFFPPEPNRERASLDRIVEAIRRAQHSVVMCAFDPTDGDLLQALFDKADEGKMMLALVNTVSDHAPAGDPERSDVAAKIAIMDRAAKDGSFTGFSAFKSGDTPTEFLPERVLWPHENPKIMVRVHHKFVVVDAEGENPIVFTGSANFSNNSLHKNDENLIEISACPRVAAIYLAEFLRLFEHYRARAAFERRQGGDRESFRLTADASWARKYFVPGSTEAKARQAMAGT